jgi:hypothetical protein
LITQDSCHAISMIAALLTLFLMSNSPVSQAAENFQSCQKASDCILVQNTWCKTTVSINKQKSELWKKSDQENYANSKKNKVKCKPVIESHFNLSNFTLGCVSHSCQATYTGP